MKCRSQVYIAFFMIVCLVDTHRAKRSQKLKILFRLPPVKMNSPFQRLKSDLSNSYQFLFQIRLCSLPHWDGVKSFVNEKDVT